MKSQKIATTLGYAALVIIALYFVFGILKLSGQGLANMGFSEHVMEGMTDKDREKAEKDIEDANTNIEEMLEQVKENKFTKSFVNFDDTAGFDDFKENLITLINFNLEVKKNMLISGMINTVKKKKGKIDFNNKYYQDQMDQINRLVKFRTFLEEHENVQY